jgi:UDP-N-acetylmuramoyl-tripeptide--D-alanyl-D-alanine ligase
MQSNTSIPIPGLILFLLCGLLNGCVPDPSQGPPGECPAEISRDLLDASLTAGTSFLLANQLEEGRFAYEYDWVNQTDSLDDHPVRQAGAAWGLALIYQDSPSEQVLAGALEALEFFATNSVLNEAGHRYIIYPAADKGTLGTVALVTLAHIELLRSDLDDETHARLDEHLGQYLGFVVATLTEEWRFQSSYSHDSGEAYGDPSPYYEGEALLGLAKAAHYLGRDDLLPTIQSATEAGYAANVRDALAADPDSSTTKGYYQWSSMSYFEYTLAGWENADEYGQVLLDLAEWMIDVHKTLERSRNTAYAYEGLIPALVEARRVGDTASAEKIECTIHRGLEKLTSWQVGGPNPNSYIQQHSTDDERAIGGVQNHAEEPGLRIDVTQHQMHAVLLARRYLFATE